MASVIECVFVCYAILGLFSLNLPMKINLLPAVLTDKLLCYNYYNNNEVLSSLHLNVQIVKELSEELYGTHRRLIEADFLC